MKHEGFATAFERLDREILALKRLVSLSELFSWNYASKLTAVRLELDPPKDKKPWRLRWSVPELFSAGLALSVALLAGGVA